MQHLSRGGTEKSVCKLSVELSKKFNVIIATFLSSALFPATYLFSGTLICLNETGSESSISKLIKRRKFVSAIKRDNDIDISISFLKSADLINAMTSSDTHKSILSVRTDLDKLIIGKKNRLLYSYIFSKMNAVHVQNISNYNKLLCLIDASKVELIPNYFNIQTIRSQCIEKLEFVNRQTHFIFGITGTLYRAKGQKHIFKIMSDLKKDDINNMILVLQGGLDSYREYEQYASSLGLNVKVSDHEEPIDLNEADIFVLGFSSNPYKMISSVDATILSSYYEGSPNALVESMICGIPAIAADCQTGPREILYGLDNKVEESRGYLLPVFAEESLAVKELSKQEEEWKQFLKQVLTKEIALNDRVSEATKYVQQYDVNVVISQWHNLIQNV